MMDAHYVVIRQYLDAEHGPGFAHRVNKTLLRISARFLRVGRILSALTSVTDREERLKEALEELSYIADDYVNAAGVCLSASPSMAKARTALSSERERG